MNILLIINDAPYGSEKAYNALRMAMTLQKEHAADPARRRQNQHDAPIGTVDG